MGGPVSEKLAAQSVTAGPGCSPSSVFFGKEAPTGQGQSLGHAKDLELPAELPYEGYELGCQMLFVLRPRGAGDHRIGDICGSGGQRGKMWFPRP